MTFIFCTSLYFGIAPPAEVAQTVFLGRPDPLHRDLDVAIAFRHDGLMVFQLQLAVAAVGSPNYQDVIEVTEIEP